MSDPIPRIERRGGWALTCGRAGLRTTRDKDLASDDLAHERDREAEIQSQLRSIRQPIAEIDPGGDTR
jgi:hypothetical protein